MSAYIKKTLVRASVIFTAICAVFALFNFLLYGDTEEGGGVESFRLVMFFIFSLIFSAANEFFMTRKYSAILRYSVHCIATVSAFYIGFVMPLGVKSSTAMVAVALFFFVYAVTMGIIYAFSSRIKKTYKKPENEYKSIFKKDNK